MHNNNEKARTSNVKIKTQRYVQANIKPTPMSSERRESEITIIIAITQSPWTLITIIIPTMKLNQLMELHAEIQKLCPRTIIRICLRGARRSEQDYAKEPSSEFVSGAHGEANKTMPRNHHQNFSVSLVRCLSM